MPNEKKRVFIGFCLDKSGSMKKIWKAIIKGLNQEILAVQESAAASDIETYVSFYVFDKKTHKVFDVKSVNHLTEIAEEDFEPKGDTAVYGCINDMIDSLSNAAEEADPRNSYIVKIYSDGEETVEKSRRPATSQRIKEKQDGGKWTFVFVGCDQDLESVNTGLNISKGNLVKFRKSGEGVLEAFSVSTNATRNYMQSRAAGQMQNKNCVSEKDEITDLTLSDEAPMNMKTFRKT